MGLIQNAAEQDGERSIVRGSSADEADIYDHEMLLSKYQTLGNSYLVFDPIKNNVPGFPSPKWVRTICDGNYGIGSSGLLVGPNDTDGAAFEFRIFNSDGSQAELSGNGSRIFARYLMDAGYIAPAARQNFSIAAVSSNQRRILIDVSAESSLGAEIFTAIRIAPSFGPHAVGALEGAVWSNGAGYTVAALADVGRRKGQGGGLAWSDSMLVSIGNPHCVTFVTSAELLPSFQFLMQQKDELSLVVDAPSSGSANPVFVDGCNLQWCFVESRGRIHLRIVERGEGPTLASGSSASAATVAAFKRGLIDRQVTVVMPGGSLTVTLLLHKNDIASVGLSGVACRLAEIKMNAFAEMKSSPLELG
jgi:diaminopimelate epimerase